MKEQICINDNIFHAVRVASAQVSCSKDYITRLAREQKIRAVHIGRNWYVDIDALTNYEQAQKIETSARNRQLKLQRKTEHSIREKIGQSQASLVIVKYQLAAYSCLLLLFTAAAGALSGLGLANLNVSASVGASVVPDDAVVNKDSEILVPRFVEVNPNALIVGGSKRVISTPVTETDWLRIRYE